MSIRIDACIVSDRNEAISRGHGRYIGSACRDCGSKVRYVIGYQCINCARNKQRKKNGTFETNIDPLKTKQRIDAKLEELALMRELDCLS